MKGIKSNPPNVTGCSAIVKTVDDKKIFICSKFIHTPFIIFYSDLRMASINTNLAPDFS